MSCDKTIFKKIIRVCVHEKGCIYDTKGLQI